MSQYGDGDYCSVFRESTRVARKVHRCRACGETIAVGQSYAYTFLVFDGESSVYRRCARCQAIYVHLNDRIGKEGDSEEFCDQGLNCGHEYEERWGEPPPEHLAALAFWLPGDPLPVIEEKAGSK